tara:strand:- start:1012 stop:2100 length:1089 start_codon:yes stop_codon:yes gene_type:complete
MGITSPSFPGGTAGATGVFSDLEIDGTTVVVDETNNRVGIGTASPQVQLEVHDTTTSSANTGGALRLSANDGAVMGDSHRLGVIEFTGAEDSGGTQTVGARIEALTEAAWTNAENGAALYFYTTDGNASQTNVLKLDSTKKATFSGVIDVAGTAPDVTLRNSTSENTDGGCESKIIFEDHANVALAQIQGSHDGSSDDTKGDLIFSTHTGSALTEVMRLDSDKRTSFAGDVVVNNAFAAPGASGTFGTFGDGDATPSVAAGNLWKHHASTETITMFDDGLTGQTITVISTAAITYDVTGTNLKGGSTDLVTANGDVTEWCFDGTNWYLIQFMDVTADMSTVGGGGGTDANDVDALLHHQVFS